MIDIKFLREQPELFKEKMAARGQAFDPAAFSLMDEKRRASIKQVEQLRSERNSASDEIARMKKDRQTVSPDRFSRLKEISSEIKALDEALKQTEEEINALVMTLPNPPHHSVALGKTSDDNPVVKTAGSPPAFDFEPKPHDAIGEALGILDFDRAAKISGARFSLYKGAGARLERALINFMLDLHIEQHGYTEIIPPVIVNRQTMTGTGQLPKFEEDLFKLEGLDTFLIPTAEVPLTNIFQNETLRQDDLPVYYVSYTPCFRKEAGSHGRDTRGLIRQHQFNKVELVKFTTPQDSYPELEKLLLNAEEVLKRLNIHYRVVTLCTGDLGFAASKTYDIEVWLPSQQTYREISSCSNFEDFQARRAGIRYKDRETQKNRYLHTLNGSGLAVGRTFVAVLENYQQADGTVVIPEVLRPYMGGLEKIE